MPRLHSRTIKLIPISGGTSALTNKWKHINIYIIWNIRLFTTPNLGLSELSQPMLDTATDACQTTVYNGANKEGSKVSCEILSQLAFGTKVQVKMAGLFYQICIVLGVLQLFVGSSYRSVINICRILQVSNTHHICKTKQTFHRIQI